MSSLRTPPARPPALVPLPLLLLPSLALVLALLLNPTHAWRLPTSLQRPPSIAAKSAPTSTRNPTSALFYVPFSPATAAAAAARRLLFSLPLLLPLLPFSSAQAFPGLEDCTSESNPSFTIVTCARSGIDPVAQRPPKCLSAENCISSSSVQSASKYMSPWVYGGAAADTPSAWLSLVRAVEAQEGVKVVEIDNGSKQYYLRAEVGSKVPLPPGGIDDIEFLMSPKDGLVFFRSASRQMAFLYPLTQPVGDGGSIKRRLEAIQKVVGWSTVEDYYAYE